MAKFKFKKRGAESAQRRLSGEGKDPWMKQGVKFFKPADGANNLRFMPPTWDDAEHYGIDIYVHYQVGAENISYLCPRRMNGDDCPICEEMQQAQEEGDEEYARTLYPTRRVLAYVVDTKNPKDGVKAWAMPYKKVDQQIVLQSTDPDTSEYFPVDDPEEGFNITINKSGSGLTTDYGVIISRHASEFRMTEEIYEFLMDNPLPDILNFYSYDHISKALHGSGKSHSEPSGKEKETPKKAPKRRKNTTEVPSSYEEIMELDSDVLDVVCAEHTDLDVSMFKSDEELRAAIAAEFELVPEEADEKDDDDSNDEEDEEPPKKKETFKERMARINAARS